MLAILLQPEDRQIDWSCILDRLSKTYLASKLTHFPVAFDEIKAVMFDACHFSMPTTAVVTIPR